MVRNAAAYPFGTGSVRQCDEIRQPAGKQWMPAEVADGQKWRCTKSSINVAKRGKMGEEEEGWQAGVTRVEKPRMLRRRQDRDSSKIQRSDRGRGKRAKKKERKARRLADARDDDDVNKWQREKGVDEGREENRRVSLQGRDDAKLGGRGVLVKVGCRRKWEDYG